MPIPAEGYMAASSMSIQASLSTTRRIQLCPYFTGDFANALAAITKTSYEHHGISNHRQLVCPTACLGYHDRTYQSLSGPLWTFDFPYHRANDTENVSMSWRHMQQSCNDRAKIVTLWLLYKLSFSMLRCWSRVNSMKTSIVKLFIIGLDNGLSKDV